MGSRYDTDIFLRKEGLLDHARVESGEASNGDVDLARFEPRDQLLASQRHGLEAHIRRHLPYPFEHARQHQQMRSEEHTSELQSLMRISYAVVCLKKKKKPKR